MIVVAADFITGLDETEACIFARVLPAFNVDASISVMRQVKRSERYNSIKLFPFHAKQSCIYFSAQTLKSEGEIDTHDTLYRVIDR